MFACYYLGLALARMGRRTGSGWAIRNRHSNRARWSSAPQDDPPYRRTWRPAKTKITGWRL